MAAANVSSEKVDLLIYGPVRPILENGFSDQFVLHMAESRADLERLTPDTIAKIRGMAVTYHMVPADAKALSQFPKLEMIASFGVGYDHVDSAYAREHNIVVTNTPDVLTEEVADVAMGLLISTVREFVKADRYLRSGLAFRIAESGYRLNIPRMFAALLLLSVAGIVIYGLLALVSHLVLRRWHESALGKEN